jgi:dTDP-4-amino-4,6-dideoxygalactose transaminase
MKNFGFAGYDNVIYIGTNGKMPEVSAAMGLSSLERLPEFVESNRRNYHGYLRELSGVPGIRVMRYNECEACNYQYVILEVDEEDAGIDRDRLLRVLHAENVFARRYFFPGCHRMEPYRSFFPHAGLLLPNTGRLARRVLSLPTGTAVGEREIRGVCGIVRLAVSRAGEVRQGLDRLQ